MASDGLQLKYFVLAPTKDDSYGQASRKALLAFAANIQETNRELATDLRLWEVGCRYNIQAAAMLAHARGENVP